MNLVLYSILPDALVLTQEPSWHMLRHMKAVTIHVEELVYRDFQKLARRTKRSTSELIREAMDNFRRSSGKPKTPLWQATKPASVGHIKIPWTGRENLADGFFDRE
ncbi:MAG: ribbon-helix-helix protein, CopG family [Terrimicrobiaceae bacterium]